MGKIPGMSPQEPSYSMARRLYKRACSRFQPSGRVPESTRGVEFLILSLTDIPFCEGGPTGNTIVSSQLTRPELCWSPLLGEDRTEELTCRHFQDRAV